MADDIILDVDQVEKVYGSGVRALHPVSLTIRRGEIVALLGPNGAGKTTLISIVCGLVEPTAGRVTVDGHDIAAAYRAARRVVGLVPQEIALEPFDSVISSIRFTRGLFGMRPNEAHLTRLLKTLSLWDKRDEPLKELSGGMRRRVLIAKALAHEPRLLFLDEPTAGVDVELRKDMWRVVRALQNDGVTVILTTHYIEEAEAIAERVGVISQGRVLLVEEKDALMQRLGRREVHIVPANPVAEIPPALNRYGLRRADDGSLFYGDEAAVPFATLFADLAAADIVVANVHTRQRSLEDIFVELVAADGLNAEAAQ